MEQEPDQQEIEQRRIEAEIMAMHDRGLKSEALALAEDLTKAYPQNLLGWKVLATLYPQQNRREDAVYALQQALLAAPFDANLYYNLGTELLWLKRLDEAVNALRQAISIAPGMTVAVNNLGVALKRLQQLEDAVACFGQAIRLQPDYAEAHNNLGECLNALGRFDEAVASYQRAMESKPGYVEAYNNLGYNYKQAGQYDQAITSFRQALAINPAYEVAHNNLGTVLMEMGQWESAEACYRAALEINPDYFQAHLNMGNVYLNQHQFTQAISAYRQVLEISPEFQEGFNNLLFCVNYHPDYSSEELYAYYPEFEARFARPLYKEWKPHLNDRDPARRLKVGYVSPSFRHHSTRHFLEPLLARHDHGQFEIYAYAQYARADDVTARYQGYMDHWIPTRGMSDAALAERIRADGIDILVDLAGHTGDNRLQVFARKPAPVSLHWLDFGYTTGMTAIDYYLTDEPTAPPGSEPYFAEQLWRLPAPTPAYVYRPAEGMGEVGELPAARKGHVTFGTLTRAVRLNYKLVRVWSEILKAVPDSHLIINSTHFKSEEMQERMMAQFMAHGIARERLEIGADSPPWDVLRDIDIGLDCFPHNSGTTLFETLYMGIPFVTLANRPSVGTLGASVLHGIGHPEWIAETEQEYIDKAVAVANDLPALAELRNTLRPQMEQSPLMDEAGFTKAVEQAYRQMWQKWCKAIN